MNKRNVDKFDDSIVESPKKNQNYDKRVYFA